MCTQMNNALDVMYIVSQEHNEHTLAQAQASHCEAPHGKEGLTYAKGAQQVYCQVDLVW